MKYLISFILFTSATLAYAESYCSKTQGYNQTIGVWDRKCGPNPNKDFLEEAKYDCKTTRKTIEENTGASWNSSMGWMYEDQCERLEQSSN